MVGHLDDVITCAKFQVEIFRGYDFTGGRISHFPIAFCMGLTTVQRDCAACDVMAGSVTGEQGVSRDGSPPAGSRGSVILCL